MSVPLIIDKLNDTDPYVVLSAHSALKHLTRKDFGPVAGATREEHDKAVQDWKAWWEKEGK